MNFSLRGFKFDGACRRCSKGGKEEHTSPKNSELKNPHCKFNENRHSPDIRSIRSGIKIFEYAQVDVPLQFQTQWE